VSFQQAEPKGSVYFAAMMVAGKRLVETLKGSK